MEDWKEYKLGEVLSDKGYIRGPFGSALKRGDMKDSGIPVYEQQHAIYQSRDFRFYIDENKFNEMKRFQVQTNDLVISCSGTVGKVTIIDKNDPKGIISQALLILRVNSGIILPKYLQYFFTSENGYNSIISRSSGSVQINIAKRDVIEGIPLHLPPLSTQQKIAQILSSLDDKIELNNKINANLEQQAQALFKSWFVDFEPFCGEMPAGWKVGTIGDLCLTVSQTYKGNDSEVVLINTSDVENGDILNHESVANTNLKGQFKKTFQKNDILYSEIRPANRHYAFVDIDETCNYIASTKLMVIRPNEDVNPHYLYHILTNPELIKEMQHLAETRSGTFPQITFESELSTYQIPLLPKEEQDKLGNLFEKIDNMVFHNIRENKKLSNLRETLLPKLMNGEIEV